MKLNKKNFSRGLALGAIILSGALNAATTGSSAFINYTWMNTIINKTPVRPGACPEINTDIYGAGFKVAQQKSFYGSVGASGSKWFPKDELWSSVGVGPLVNKFGILFSEVKTLDEISNEKTKKLPDTFAELSQWKVSDSAYWESQGGVSFYLGAGIAPIDVGVFAVATGGWVNFLQKTGPNRVYVEMSKKHIKSVSLGAGMGRPNISVEKALESSNGFAYEFVLDNQNAIEAFERFMAGDMTRAQDLAKEFKSGVNKISDMSERRSGLSRSFGIATPFVPILSFKLSSEHAVDEVTENSVWDEDTLKETGIYTKQRNLFLAGQQIKETRSFVGGKTVNDSKSMTGPIHSESLYGQFKYSYQSNWGQEKRLRKYIDKVQGLTGIVSETCAHVPSFEDSLGFNQVVLEIKWSDSYVKELLNSNKKKGGLLARIKAEALQLEKKADLASSCSPFDNDHDDDFCTMSSEELINTIFLDLETYTAQMQKNINGDKKEFARNFAKFGEAIWRSPFVFKAFYEKGKVCGQDFRFEISGQRLTRHLVDKKFSSSAECFNEAI